MMSKLLIGGAAVAVAWLSVPMVAESEQTKVAAPPIQRQPWIENGVKQAPVNPPAASIPKQPVRKLPWIENGTTKPVRK